MQKRAFWGLAFIASLVSACGGEIGGASAEAGLGPEQVSAGPDAGIPDPTFNGTHPEPDDPSTQDGHLACQSASAVVTASSGWKSTQAPQPAFDTLNFEFMARPQAAHIDALVAVGAQNIADFSDAAIKVRFAEDGLIDAVDGDVYEYDTSFAYEAGVWYNFVVSADLDAQTYDVTVARCGETPQTLIKEASFEAESGLSDQLTAWAAWSSQSAKIDVASPSWVPAGTCAPTTCELLSLECGPQSDGCGGTLSCGGCGSGQTCAGGLCVDSSPPPADSTAPPPPPVSGDGWWNSVPQPSAANTGPSNPGLLSSANAPPSVITQDGATYENFTTSSSITISADDVTLRNFRITDPGPYGIVVTQGSSNVLIEHGEITGRVDSAGIVGAGWIGRYLYLHDYKGDAIKAESWSSSSGPTVLEHSYLHNFGIGASDPHTDGTQGAEGGQMHDMTIRYNYCDMDDVGACNRCWFFSDEPHSNINVLNNWNSCGLGSSYVFANNPIGSMLIEDNLIYCNASNAGMVEGSATWGKNNRWMDTKAVIPSPALTCATR